MKVVPFPKQQDNQLWLIGYQNWIAGKTESTQDAYLRILRQFIEWVVEKPGAGSGGFRPELLTRTAVETYMKEGSMKNASPSHKSRVKSVLSGFSDWLIEEDLLRKNPVNGIEIPAQALLAPRMLSPDQRYILKNLVEREGDPRSEAIFALGYWAGCRVSDVANLGMNDIIIGPKIGSIHVGHKGDKTRHLPIRNEVRKPLFDYINGDRQQSKFKSSPFVFLSQRGERLTEKGIHHWLRTLKSKATKDEWPLIDDVTYHDLRHDFAHRARESGWPLEYIAVYLGHIKKKGTPAIETTVRYTQPGIDTIKTKLLDIKG